MLNCCSKLDDFVHVGVVQLVQGDQQADWLLTEPSIKLSLAVEKLFKY